MNKGVKRIASLFLAVVMIVSTMVVGTSAATDAKNVGALLDSYTAGSGIFTVTTSSVVHVVGTSAPTGDLLQTAQLIQREMSAEFSGCFSEIVWGDANLAKTGDIVLNLDTGSGTGADGYKLDVNGKTATVTAADTDGLIYGANTLIKCFRAVDGNSISGFSAYDTPDTKERTVHLDLARKYYTVEWVKNFIKQISWMGYNALELHLSEDGGFRADFWDGAYYTDNYKPENDFSWLCGSYAQYWCYDIELPDGTTGYFSQDPDKGKYLTTAELVEICNVAKEYHIEIIPSFDSPAHMDYITWKFEQNYKSNKSYSFTYDGTTYKASSTSGCINFAEYTGGSAPGSKYTTIDITEGTMARAFVFALYEDMADFFKEYAGSTNFMIGADEVPISNSKTWDYSDFPGYINSLNRMLNNKGYVVRMYNDFIGSTTYNQSNSKAVYDFDDNIEIVYWNSDYNPTTGAWEQPIWHAKFFWENNTGTSDNWGDGGRTMYNAIQTNTYYVLRIATSGNNRDARDPDNRNWTFYHTNEEDIYNEWYPADISEKGVNAEDAADVPADQLGGAYFLIWNDYAAVSKESEVWNGALDGWDKDRYYYLFDIMASNIMKMWNADINDSVTYSKFADVREATLEWFPGYSDDCSEASVLPAADTTLTQAADHTDLTNAINNSEMIANTDGKYTDESYAVYTATYNTALENAKKVDANHAATADQIADAIEALQDAEQDAKNNLVENSTDGDNTGGDNTGGDNTDEGKDDSTTDSSVNTPTLSSNFTLAYLKTLVRNAFTSAPFGISSGADCWENIYQPAVTAAEGVINNSNRTQTTINEAVTDLLAAENALVATADTGVDPIISVNKISATASGSYITLKVVTRGDIAVISVDGFEDNLDDIIAQGKLQKLKDGKIVKVWLVRVPADGMSGDYTADINGDKTGITIATAQ